MANDGDLTPEQRTMLFGEPPPPPPGLRPTTPWSLNPRPVSRKAPPPPPPPITSAPRSTQTSQLGSRGLPDRAARRGWGLARQHPIATAFATVLLASGIGTAFGTDKESVSTDAVVNEFADTNGGRLLVTPSDIPFVTPPTTSTTEPPPSATATPSTTTTTAPTTATTVKPATTAVPTTATPTTNRTAEQNCQGYDPCIEPGPDVDCRGGSGNGPRYSGPVRVVGADPYDLDRNNDGWGCENS